MKLCNNKKSIVYLSAIKSFGNSNKGSLINLRSVIKYVLKLSDLYLSQNKILKI